MKRLINKLSLLLALILVINSCNTFNVLEVNAEDTSNLTIIGVNLDTGNAFEVNEDRILTSKSLRVTIITKSSSNENQTFKLYKFSDKNVEEKECIAIKPSKEFGENEYTAQADFTLEVDDNTYYTCNYKVGVVSESHPTEVLEEIGTSSDGKYVTNIIVDTQKPTMNNPVIDQDTTIVDGEEQILTSVSASFTDEALGIKKIEYNVNNDSRWQTYYEANDTLKNTVLFSQKFAYIINTINIKVTDYLGNELECSKNDFTIQYSDNREPDINSIEFEPYIDPTEKDNTESSTTDALTFEKISDLMYEDKEGEENKICVVYKPFTIKVDVVDRSQNASVPVVGVKKVELYNGDEKIGVMSQAEKNSKYYTYTIKDSLSTDKLIVRAEDNKGNTITTEVKNIPGGNQTSKYYMEKISPSSKPDYINAINSNGKYWYNSDGRDFIIEVEDEDSGIKSITISDKTTTQTKELINKTFVKQEKQTKEVIDTSLLATGKHTFIVTAVDNCGNKLEAKQYDIYVDHSAPSISYKVNSPKTILIDNKDWYDIDDELEITATITKSISDIADVRFKINECEYNYDDTINDIKDTFTVTLRIPVKDYLQSNENEICIVGYVEGESGNNNNFQDIYTCYIDKEDPEIKSISINKGEVSLFESSLNLIYTGIYSNTSVKFKVEASDVEGDSGVDYVEFAYYKNDTRIVRKLSKTESEYEYILPFPVDSDVFNCEFEIVAYDKYGKNSKYSPTIKDSEGNRTDNYFIMQENIIPEIEINLPKSDGRERTDNQVWYNKNKDISVKLQDMQSGIRYAKIVVNDVEIKEDVNGKKIIDIETSKNLNKNETSLIYNFTTDYIIDKVGEAEDGNYKIKIEISDNAGNIQVNNKKEFNIDEIKPNVDKVTFSKKSADDILSTDDFVTGLKYGFYFNNTFYLKIDMSDEKPSSGLDRIDYKLVSYNNGKKEKTDEKTAVIINGVARIDVPKDFKGQIFIKAVDMVGNVSKEVTTLGYVEDENSPEIEISPLKDTKYKDNNGNNLYAKNVAVNVTIRDTKSGIKTLEYYVDAENNKVEKKTISLANEGYKEGDKLENGWVITKMDKNLVVEVKQKFVFESDDNDIEAHFKAADRAGNITKNCKTQKFSIDKTKPIIRVDFADGVKSNPKYYNGSKKAIMTITVEERNFDEKLVDFVVDDSYNNNSITPKFVKEKGKYSYVATIDYPEGDYSVHISGKDIVGHEATVFENGQKKGQESYATDFIVDTTNPSISTNFSSFNNTESKKGNYFNKKKTATITVTEHNFDSELMNLNVWEKQPGQGQNLNGTEKYSYAAYSSKGWNDNGDVHSIELQFERDGIYKVEIKPSDLSENEGETDSTVVFEIDTTAPEVLLINGESVDKKKTNTVEVYDESRKEDALPTVEYYDANFDYIKYEIVKYVPEYSEGKKLSKVEPILVKKSIDKKEFKLDEFEKDGIYAVEMVAYDKAGNASKVNNNTYVRMMKTDVLAYIENSTPSIDGKIGTGWYSIEDEDGPLSKRPDNFEDLNIAVLTKNDTKTSITLNSNDGDITDTGVECSTKEEVYGAGVYRYVLSKDYFKDHYQEDTDATFYLTVNNNDSRIELGQIHIDNIAPECELPSYFHNWGWMKGSGDKSIKITNISEKIDVNSSFVYVDGEKVEYNYDSSENTLEFPIKDGSHSIGISLVDYAGNEYNIPEISHLGVGNFRLYLGIGATILILAGCSGIIIFRRKRKVRNLE